MKSLKFHPVTGLFSNLVALLLGAFLAVSPAWGEITVGAEFEFVDPHAAKFLASGLKGHEQALAETFTRAARAKCLQTPGCREIPQSGKWGSEARFILSSGFWFQVSWDPNVVEVLTKPVSLSEFQKIAPEVQRLVFETAQETGLAVDPEKRAGHFNFGAHASFDRSGVEFLKYVIDYSNRPELAAGIFRDINLLNAPPLAVLEAEQKNALTRIAQSVLDPQKKYETSSFKKVLSFYTGLAKPPHQMSLREMAKLLISDVFYRSTNDRKGVNAYHYQALGLKKIPSSSPTVDAPIEIRAVRSQRDVWDFLLLAELTQARIEYLKNLDVKTALLVTETSRTQFSSAELVKRFYIYVSEAGLPWQKFRRLLPPKLLEHESAIEIFKPDARIQKGPSVEALRPLLDLLATSPWFKENLQRAWQEGRISSEAQTEIWRELQILESQSKMSRTALQEIQKAVKGFSSAPGLCSRLFL